jgi:undecaprenyl-diphosphatase
MRIIEAVSLGAAQGLTEFLPVSSSGHLVFLQKIYGISEDALLFDTMVYAGTLAAVFAFLRKDIWAILKKPVQPLTGYLITATIPAAALLFKDSIEAAFASASFPGIAFLITAALLLTAEFLSRIQSSKRLIRGQDNMNALDAIIIGCLQAAAIIPGVSRSGSTLPGALARRLDRDFAARFSFLLSIPAIPGALVPQIKELAADCAEAGAEAGAAPAGTLTAAIVGFFPIKFMLRLVKERRLWGFAIYTGVLGIAILAVWR